MALLWICTSISMSLLFGGNQDRTQHSRWVSPVLRGRLTSLDLLVILLPMATFAVRAYYWLMVNLASTRNPWSFSTKLLSSLWVHSL